MLILFQRISCKVLLYFVADYNVIIEKKVPFEEEVIVSNYDEKEIIKNGLSAFV